MEETILNAIRSIFPIEKEGTEIKLNTLYTERSGEYYPKDFTGQKKAIETGATYGPAIYGEFSIYQDGELQKKQKKKVGVLPLKTDRGTFIVKGTEYSLVNQLLLRPGIYSREKNNGEMESAISIKGISPKIIFDPSTLKLSLMVRQSKTPLYSFLKILGVSDTDMQSTFGDKIFHANYSGNITGDVKKLHSAFFRFDDTPDSTEEAMNKVKDYFNSADLNSKISKITLGETFTSVTGKAVLTGAKKLISIYRGEAEPDNRDDIRFKRIRVSEDFIGDRIAKNAKRIAADMLSSITRHGVIATSPINDVIESSLTQATTSEMPMGVNPVSIVGAQGKTTIMGEDGISSVHGIPEESRNLHPSQIGMIDPINTPESIKAGVTVSLAANTWEKNGDIVSKYTDVKTGRNVTKSAIDLSDSYVALPGEYVNGKFSSPDNVKAIHNGQIVSVKKNKIEYAVPEAEEAFSLPSNLIPFINHNQGNRAAMGARQLQQAVSLTNPDVPFVQVAAPESYKKYGDTAERVVASAVNTISAPEDGKIVSVSDTEIIMKTKSGKEVKFDLYNNFPLSNKSFISNIVKVAAGQSVSKGDLLADTNFSKDGVLAIGKNLKVAYMPWHGDTFEDGMVISESAAKKLTSSHMIQQTVDISDGVVIDKSKFVAMFPTKFTSKQLSKLDTRGIIKTGVTVEPGDPIILVMREETGGPEDLILQKLHKSITKPYKDRSVTWDYSVPGTITSAAMPATKRGIAKVYVKTDLPTVIGDKLSLRHGMKGVITQIVPDEEMPFSNDTKEPADMIISPAGVITRMSIGQMLEAGASKIAKKNGTPYIVKNFDNPDNLKDIQNDLKKSGFASDGTEEFVDKKTGKSYGRVLSGYPQVNKLFKMTKANFSARAQGQYDINMRPAKGGEEGAKAIDFPQTFYSLISHGAKANLRDAATYKGDMSPEAWDALLAGRPLPNPKTPFAYQKFESMLMGAGANPRRDGDNITLSPMTNADVDALAEGRAVKNTLMLKGNMAPEEGGLFDSAITGGTNGNRWSKMDIVEPIPNPMFEQGIKVLTGLKAADYDAVISGEKSIDPKTLKLRNDSTGLISGAAIRAMLKKIDVDEGIEYIQKEFNTSTLTKKHVLSKTLKILQGAKKTGTDLQDALVMDKIPIIPPKFRPVFELPNGMIGVSGVNYLYRDIGYINDTMKAAKDLPMSEREKLRMSLYKAVGAMQGVNPPVSQQAKRQNVTGLIKEISGATPKAGFFQNKVMRKQQDLSGRATAALGRDLDMDELNIPVKMSQKLYGPFAMKILMGLGYSPDDAKTQIDDLTETGKRALQEAMKDRPILMNRAPSLHKFSIMAFKPTMYDGLTIKVPGLITKPYGLDFDGDTVQVHVPFSEEARKEAFKMLPSNNLFRTRTPGLNYMPDQEAIIGLYLLTKTGRKTRRKYATLSEAMKHFEAKKFEVHDMISISGKQTTIGRELINSILPDEYDVPGPVTKDTMEEILTGIAKTHKSQYAKITKELKDLGDDYATDIGFTVTLDDLSAGNTDARKLLTDAAETGDIARMIKADKKVSVMADNAPESNNFAAMVRSGGRGSGMNVKQILYAPGLVSDMSGVVVPSPITRSYGEGLDYPGYFTSLYGTRKGVINTATMTALPGAFNKEILSSALDIVVTENDCGTSHGIMMRKNDPNIIGRTLAKNYGEFKKNSILSSFAVSKLPNNVLVRSPLTCEASNGVCQMCYGYSENGVFPELGDNVGVRSTQAMTEPLTQAAMKTKHTGGVENAGGADVGGFWSIRQFMEAPKNFPGEGMISRSKGIVESIGERPGGGYDVTVSGEKYITPPMSTLTVKKGQKINAGDKLNVGIGHPQKILDASGPQGVVTELHNLYTNTGIDIDPKHIETVFRNIAGYGEVTDNGDDSTLLPGDIVPVSRIKGFNDTANGKIQYRQTIVGVNKSHNVSDNWMGRLGFRNIARGVQEGALYGQSTNIHGSNPIPAYAIGEISTKGINY